MGKFQLKLWACPWCLTRNVVCSSLPKSEHVSAKMNEMLELKMSIVHIRKEIINFESKQKTMWKMRLRSSNGQISETKISESIKS